MMSISISDWIQVVAVLISTLTGIVGIVLSVTAIKQTNISNELAKQAAQEMARPYVDVYFVALGNGRRCLISTSYLLLVNSLTLTILYFMFRELSTVFYQKTQKSFLFVKLFAIIYL